MTFNQKKLTVWLCSMFSIESKPVNDYDQSDSIKSLVITMPDIVVVFEKIGQIQIGKYKGSGVCPTQRVS